MHRLLLSLAFLLVMLFTIPYSASGQATIIEHPVGMDLIIDHSYNLSPASTDLLFQTAAGFWDEINNWDRAYELYLSGDLIIFKINNQGYDFAMVYKGQCAVITIASGHF